MAHPDFEKTIGHFKSELLNVRTGRVTPALIERVEVEVYGSKMKLIEVASMSASDARTLVVDAWDKSNLKDIEKALQLHPLGLSVNNDGSVIRVSIPQLTEESRNEIIKTVKDKLEHAKVQMRKTRDHLRDGIQHQLKEKEISEDDKYDEFEKIDKETKEHTDKLQSIADAKIEELKI